MLLNSKYFLTTIITNLLLIVCVQAQNPIIPAGTYGADATARVLQDGKLYIYASTDESVNYPCSWHFDALSTSDLKTWTVTKNIFSSKGDKDQVPYSNAPLFAPDIAYKNGTYYLYYCQPDLKNPEGVATSKSPLGPFVNGKSINLFGNNQIDPGVFIDDDGQAYYIWGQFQAKMAKLKPNMIEIDSATIKYNVVTQKEHFFHEASYMIKRNGIYYFIYTHMGRADRATSLGYATSKSPMGPFKYGGVIIDTDHSDTATWNNHGSLVEFNKQWYVVYHHSTHGDKGMRKICIEPIKFNEDGSINEVEMTTQGAGSPLDAKEKIDAERACLLYGNVRVDTVTSTNEALTQIQKGDFAAYKYIDFKDGLNNVTASIIPGRSGGSIDVVLDNSWGPSVGTIKIPAALGNDKNIEISTTIKSVKGVHAVWLRFNSDNQESFKLDWFKFK